MSPLVYVPKQSGEIRITVNYQKLDKVTEIPHIVVSRVDEVLDAFGGGSVLSVIVLFLGFTQSTIHPDIIPLTAFGTPTGLYGLLCIPQSTAGSPAWFIAIMRLVTTGFVNSRKYLDHAIS